jgi:hypothetical protein
VLKLEISTRDENWNEVHEEIGTGAYLTSVIGFTASVHYDPPSSKRSHHHHAQLYTYWHYRRGLWTWLSSFQSGLKFSQLKTESN